MKKVLFILMIILTSCTESTNTVNRLLVAEGCSNIKETGYRFFGCSEGDYFHSGFECTKNNTSVSGVICGGWLKAHTIRWD